MLVEVLSIFVVTLIITNMLLIFFIGKILKFIDESDREIIKTFHAQYLDMKKIKDHVEVFRHDLKRIDSEVKLSKEEIEILMTESLANQARLNRLEQFCSSLSQQYAQIFDISHEKDKP